MSTSNVEVEENQSGEIVEVEEDSQGDIVQLDDNQGEILSVTIHGSGMNGSKFSNLPISSFGGSAAQHRGIVVNGTTSSSSSSSSSLSSSIGSTSTPISPAPNDNKKMVKSSKSTVTPSTKTSSEAKVKESKQQPAKIVKKTVKVTDNKGKRDTASTDNTVLTTGTATSVITSVAGQTSTSTSTPPSNEDVSEETKDDDVDPKDTTIVVDIEEVDKDNKMKKKKLKEEKNNKNKTKDSFKMKEKDRFILDDLSQEELQMIFALNDIPYLSIIPIVTMIISVAMIINISVQGTCENSSKAQGYMTAVLVCALFATYMFLVNVTRMNNKSVIDSATRQYRELRGQSVTDTIEDESCSLYINVIGMLICIGGVVTSSILIGIESLATWEIVFLTCALFLDRISRNRKTVDAIITSSRKRKIAPSIAQSMGESCGTRLAKKYRCCRCFSCFDRYVK